MLADINCHSKMTSVMALDSVTLFLRLKDVTNTCKCIRNSPTIAGFLQCNGRKLEKLKTSNVFSYFIVCSNRNRSALVCELFCNNSLAVSYTIKIISLALCARDSIFFTTDLQTVNYYSTIHC